MKPWKVALLVGALVGVGLLAAVAIASGADKSISGAQERGTGQCDGDGALREGRANGQAGGMLRGAGASSEMQTWRDRYGDDPNSSEARSALQAIRDEHRADAQALMGGNGGCTGDGDGQGQGFGHGQGYGQGGGMTGDGNGW